MGVSFKVAKAGTRYRPKPMQVEDKEIDSEPTFDRQRGEDEVAVLGFGEEVTDYSIAMAKPGLDLFSKHPEVSFSLSLFRGGFTIGKPNELFNGVPKQLHPYDRASETLFCAIESGRLPGDILDDLPCKYVNGALSCEIQDYRNLFLQNGDTRSSRGSSPVGSKVVLQMCTESVVKDISSFSDDSWTYNDLLEFESRILKALRPDLQLDPKPMLHRLCKDSLLEKVNLGISWSRKRRKFSDASTTDHISSYTSHRIDASEVCAQNSNSRSDGELQDGVSYMEQLIPDCIITSQRNNTHQENVPHSSFLMYQSNFKSGADQSVHGALTSLALSAPKPNYGNVDPRIPSSLILGDSRRNGTTPYGGPISKIQMNEPWDISQEQLSENQAQTKVSTKSRLKNKLQRIPHEKTHKKMHSPPCRINGLQVICEGIPRLQHVPTSTVKQEPIETSRCQSLNVVVRDNGRMLDLRSDGPNFLHPPPCRINGQQAICEGIPRLHQVPTSTVKQEPIETSRCQTLNVVVRDNGRMLDLRTDGPSRSSRTVKPNVQANTMQSSPVCQSAGKNMTLDVSQGQRGKALKHSQVSSGANASLPFPLSNSLPRQASVPTKGKSYSLKGLSENSVESLAGTNATNTASALCLLVNTLLPWPSIIEDPVLDGHVPSEIIGPLLDRFSKAEMVSQRFALNKRKRKFNDDFERKSFCGIAPLVCSHLLNSEDKTMKDGNTDATSRFECSQNNNRLKTRKFTFERTSHVPEGNGAPSIEAEDKVSIVEKLDEEGLVEVSLTYGHEESDPIESYLLQEFANAHHGNLFGNQFSSLMICEGYRRGGDQIEIGPLDVAGSSSNYPQFLFCAATPAPETVELVPPTPIKGQSLCTLSPIGSCTSLSPLIPGHALSQNNFSGGHLLPSSANTQSTFPLSASYFSTSPLEIASQSMHPQWQHIVDRRAYLQLQMLRRDRQQQHLWQRMMMMREFGPTPDTTQLGSGVHGTRNVGLDSTFGNPTGYLSLLGGGNFQGSGSSGGKNTPAAVMAKRIRIAENGGGTLMSGFSVDGSDGVGPPNLPTGAYQTSNRLPLPMHVQQQLYMQTYEEMRSLIQSPEATRLSEPDPNRTILLNEFTGIGASSVGFWKYNGGP